MKLGYQIGISDWGHVSFTKFNYLSAIWAINYLEENIKKQFRKCYSFVMSHTRTHAYI